MGTDLDSTVVDREDTFTFDSLSVVALCGDVQVSSVDDYLGITLDTLRRGFGIAGQSV